MGARRIGGLAKYLGRLGHEVTVLTSAISGSGPLEEAEVVRTRDLLHSGANWRRGQLDALQGSGQVVYGGASRVATWVVPDLALVTWLPFVLPRALALWRRRRFDCVITSSPPQSVHLIGLALGRGGAPWIADFRDAWRFERTPALEWPLAAQRRLDDALERAEARRADAMVGVTEAISDDLRHRFGARAETIANGFDFEQRPAPAREGDKRTLLHTGRMAVGDRSPRWLLEALVLLREQAPELAAGVEAVFAGPLTEEELDLMRRPELDGLVRWVGAVDHERALALQSGADVLILFTEEPRKGHVPAKLYEYLAARRPILVLGEDVEAASLVERLDAGLAAPPRDPAAIAERLRTLLTEPPPGPEDGALESFSYERLAERMSALIDSVAGDAQSSASR